MNHSIFQFAALLLTTSAFAYDPLFDASDPGNLGGVPAMHEGTGFPSTMTRWKSSRVQAVQGGTATHFIIRVGSASVGSVPVGFAVYAGTAGEQDPIGALLIRGYYAAHNFTAAGHYALPFTSAESIPIVAGNYYHLVYLLTPGDESAASGWRIANEPAPPPKWFSDCTKAACDADAPPGVGGEFWNDQYWPTSAGWAMGLLDASGATPGDAAILADSSTPVDASVPADAAAPPADLTAPSDSSPPADALLQPGDAHPEDRGAAPDRATAADSAAPIDGAAATDSTLAADGPKTDLDPQAPRTSAPSEGCRCRVTGARTASFPTLLSLAALLFLRRRIRGCWPPARLARSARP